MSACEITSIQGYDCAANQKRRRVELDLQSYSGSEGAFSVGEQVRDLEKDKGQTRGKIYRFVSSGGITFVDVAFKLANYTFLKMIPVYKIKHADYSALEMNLTAKRQCL